MCEPSGLTRASTEPARPETEPMTKLRDTLVAAAHLIADAIESAGTDVASQKRVEHRRRAARLPAQVLLPVSELDRKRAQRELERLGYASPPKHR
jgi:hypothetical protein